MTKLNTTMSETFFNIYIFSFAMDVSLLATFLLSLHTWEFFSTIKLQNYTVKWLQPVSLYQRRLFHRQ